MDENRNKNDCDFEPKMDFTDGVTRKEAGFIVLVVSFAITLAFAFYKAVVAGDFPSNVTDFMTMLAVTIGATEAIPAAVGKIGGGRR